MYEHAQQWPDSKSIIREYKSRCVGQPRRDSTRALVYTKLTRERENTDTDVYKLTKTLKRAIVVSRVSILMHNTVFTFTCFLVVKNMWKELFILIFKLIRARKFFSRIEMYTCDTL